MAKIIFKNLNDYVFQLKKLEGSTTQTIEKAVKAGADIVADKIKENLKALYSAHQDEALRGYYTNTPVYITKYQKRALIESFGITPVMTDNDGIINAKLGFDGYNDIKTKKWTQGQPNQLIARACESGSSAMIKQPFFRPAVTATRKAAEKAMEDTLAKEIEKITGGK